MDSAVVIRRNAAFQQVPGSAGRAAIDVSVAGIPSGVLLYLDSVAGSKNHSGAGHSYHHTLPGYPVSLHPSRAHIALWSYTGLAVSITLQFEGPARSYCQKNVESRQ